MKRIAQNKPLRKWRIVYEVGDPDWGYARRAELVTMAVSRQKAIANAMYRVDQPTFRVIVAEEVKADE